MSGRKSHNMFNKNCIRIHSPIVIFIIIFVKKENVKYTTKQRPLVMHATYRKHLECDLFPENAFSGLRQIKSTVLRMWSIKSGCSCQCHRLHCRLSFTASEMAWLSLYNVFLFSGNIRTSTLHHFPYPDKSFVWKSLLASTTPDT